ncbi:MAG TPA: hypothetical protein VH165_28635 [Kofleriaceae bacterium]|jgi:hypothetical protein|nr:hypothetical protein [Kofleriaceae bacterium]
MSLFDFPRINVWGTHVVNVGTGNNDSASPGTELTVTSNSEQVRAITHGMTDEEFRSWVTQLDQDGMLRCQWNYFGDMSIRFVDVRVRSVQLGYDHLISDADNEPLIGAPLQLNNAVMCDTNPEGYHTTQIFSETLELTTRAFSTGSFLSRKPGRATTRWLNWYRNVSYHGLFGLPPAGANGQLSSGGAGGASASFQCAIEVRKEDLVSAPGRESIGDGVFHKLLASESSQAAQALVAALQAPNARGLIFRYNLYLCFPHLSDTALAPMFASGAAPVNPAYGLVLGTLAPWYDGEPQTITLGRYLKPAAPYPNPYRNNSPYYISPIVARVDRTHEQISLDLANAMPEDGPEGYKYNLGDVVLGIRTATPPDADPVTNRSPVTPIGTIPNDRETYLRRGGLCDLSYASLPAQTKQQLYHDGYELVLAPSLAGVMLYETEYMIDTDCSTNYLDELPPGQTWNDPSVREGLAAQPDPALRGDVPLYLRKRGEIPTGTTQVKIEQWRSTPTGYPDEYGAYRYPILLGSEQITLHGGTGRYRLEPSGGPGLRTYRLVPQGVWPAQISPEVFAKQMFREFFLDLRILPYDDYSAVSESQLTWDYIYDEVFRYYHLIMPAMSQRLDLKDPTIWDTPTAAGYILRMTKTSLWGYYDYMPRSRDLSKYRRELLRRFCHKVIRERAGQA